MRPDELSRELRTASSPLLARRRGVVGLSLVAIGSMGLIALYQMGLLRHLPEPPLPALDADKVDASAEAYGRFSMPDAVLGLGSYAATMALASAGGVDRAASRPWLPLALAAKVGFDVVQAGKLTWDQWARHRAFCFWCLTAATATFACAPLVVSEARAALRALLGAGDGRVRATTGRRGERTRRA